MPPGLFGLAAGEGQGPTSGAALGPAPAACSWPLRGRVTPSTGGLGLHIGAKSSDVLPKSPWSSWALATSAQGLLLPPCCLDPHLLGTQSCSCEERAQARGCQSPRGGREGLGLLFLWSLDCVLGAGAGRPPHPGGVHQSIFLSFCIVKKIAISPCPSSWPFRMASPPPPRTQGDGGGGGEGTGCWAAVGGASLQASGHTLYWMPRKRHMAKIMAKSCTERSWLVRPSPQASTGPPPRSGRGRQAAAGRLLAHPSTLLLWGLATPAGGKPFSPAAGPFLRCSHGKKRASQTKRRSFKPSGDLGPEYVCSPRPGPGALCGAASETVPQTRK